MISVSTRRIHIISIVKDDNSGLGRTLNSIAAQQFSSAQVSILVIDGSTSETVTEVTELFSSLDISLVHKKPQGIYNAMNKGLEELALTCPEEECAIVFLNAGDFFIDTFAIQKFYVATEVNSFVVSNAAMLDPLRIPSVVFPEVIFGTGKNFMHPIIFWLPHQGIAAKFSFYKKVGLFSEDFKIAGDYDWIYRAVKQSGPPFLINDPLVVQVIDGISNRKSFSGYRERLKLAKLYGLDALKLPNYLVLKMFFKESFPSIILSIYLQLHQKIRSHKVSINLYSHEDECQCPSCLFLVYSI